MRTSDFAIVLALSLALSVSFGVARAQSTASHQISISIPTMLQLRIADGASRDLGSLDVAVDVAIEVENGVVQIDPGSTLVEVRANADWALDVRYHSATRSFTVPLHATLDGTTWHSLSGGGARLETGSATGVWHALEVTYGLLDWVSDGTYHGTVVYTLTQP